MYKKSVSRVNSCNCLVCSERKGNVWECWRTILKPITRFSLYFAALGFAHFLKSTN